MAKSKNVRLGELFLQHGLVTDEQLKQALEEQRKSGRKLGRVRRLGRVLTMLGAVNEDDVSRMLAKQLKLPYVDLRQYDIPPEVSAKLPEDLARRYRIVLLEDNGKTAGLGMADPTDLNAYDEVARALRREIEIVVVAESQLLAMLDRVYRRTGELSGVAPELGAEPEHTGGVFEIPAATPGLEDASVAGLLQSLLEDASQMRASDIHLEPQEKKLLIRFRIDGVLHQQTEADAGIAPALVVRVKLMAGLDTSERRLPQDGHFSVKIRDNVVDVRVSTLPTQFGESVVMRLLGQGRILLALEALGMPPHILARVQAVLRRPNGMILVTGPTGSGKTSTLYAALSKLNTPERKIVTVENPVEYRLPGTNQVQVQEAIDFGFARALRSALRQDPDVILVGEMRDRQTVETALRAALTGRLVLSTLHTNDAVSTPMRLLDMGAPRYMVALSLQLVLAQRLVRLICENCAESYQLPPAEHEWLRQARGAKTDRRRYVKGKGCPHCNGSGYFGRTGVYEMLEMTKPVVEAANQDNPARFFEVATRAIAGNTLHAHAAALVVEGRTTIEEAMRASNQFED